MELVYIKLTLNVKPNVIQVINPFQMVLVIHMLHQLILYICIKKLLVQVQLIFICLKLQNASQQIQMHYYLLKVNPHVVIRIK